jgi:hypothetical protein
VTVNLSIDVQKVQKAGGQIKKITISFETGNQSMVTIWHQGLDQYFLNMLDRKTHYNVVMKDQHELMKYNMPLDKVGNKNGLKGNVGAVKHNQILIYTKNMHNRG